MHSKHRLFSLYLSQKISLITIEFTFFRFQKFLKKNLVPSPNKNFGAKFRSHSESLRSRFRHFKIKPKFLETAMKTGELSFNFEVIDKDKESVISEIKSMEKKRSKSNLGISASNIKRRSNKRDMNIELINHAPSDAIESINHGSLTKILAVDKSPGATQRGADRLSSILKNADSRLQDSRDDLKKSQRVRLENRAERSFPVQKTRYDEENDSFVVPVAPEGDFRSPKKKIKTQREGSKVRRRKGRGTAVRRTAVRPTYLSMLNQSKIFDRTKGKKGVSLGSEKVIYFETPTNHNFEEKIEKSAPSTTKNDSSTKPDQLGAYQNLQNVELDHITSITEKEAQVPSSRHPSFIDHSLTHLNQNRRFTEDNNWRGSKRTSLYNKTWKRVSEGSVGEKINSKESSLPRIKRRDLKKHKTMKKTKKFFFESDLDQGEIYGDYYWLEAENRRLAKLGYQINNIIAETRGNSRKKRRNQLQEKSVSVITER